MLHYIEFSPTYRYKRGDANTNSKTIRLFTFLLTQELNFLSSVSLGHFWESGVVDSHLLEDKLIQVGLLWLPFQGASPATASGAAATLENLLCYSRLSPRPPPPWPRPPPPSAGEGCVCIGWGVGSERRTIPFPNQCLKSVMNSTPLISLPDLNLC